MFLGVTALGLGAGTIPFLLWIDLTRVFGPSVAAFYGEFRLTLTIVVVVSLIGFPLRIVDFMTLAMQRVAWFAATEIVAGLVMLAAIYLWKDPGALSTLALATMLPSIVGRLVLWVFLAQVPGRSAVPLLERIRWVDALVLLRRGLFFSAATVGEIAVVQSPVFFLGRLNGVETVPALAIPFQVFQTAMQGIVALVWPLWGAYEKA